MRWRWLGYAVAVLVAAGPARADAPTRAADPPVPVAPVAAAPHPRLDLGLVPFIGGNSDVGLGIGQLSSLTRPGPAPFAWRLESGTSLAFKRHDGHVIIPIQDYYLKLSLPRFAGADRLRLDVRVAHTAEAAVLFPGFGNASPPPDRSRPRTDYEFARAHPNAIVSLRYQVRGPWFVAVGDALTINRLKVPATSLLSELRTNGSAIERALLAGGFGAHVVDLIDLSAEYDTRDREISTSRGQYHTAKVRVSPHLGGALPYGFGRITLTARAYATPTPRLTLAARVVGDTLFGAPPFYELARYEETQAIGGGSAIRGVPAQRFYGKVKVFGNLEARAEVARFCIGHKPMALAVALFFDAGRTWTELTRAHPELDGRGLGLHYGLGGGLRWRQGAAFVVRADVAWSPDAHPIGAYFTANEIF